MSHIELRAPSVTHRLGDPRGKVSIPAISVALSEPAKSEVRYRLRIDCVFSGGIARLGSVLTAPLSGTRSASRVVAICVCPGVLEWRVKAAPTRPYNAPDVLGTLKVDAIECCGSNAGITALDGSIVEAGGPVEGVYRHTSGTAPATFVLPAGATVNEISALANSVGDATIDVTSLDGALDTVHVKVGTGFTVKPENLRGPVELAFAGNILSYFVAWREAR